MALRPTTCSTCCHGWWTSRSCRSTRPAGLPATGSWMSVRQYGRERLVARGETGEGAGPPCRLLSGHGAARPARRSSVLRRWRGWIGWRGNWTTSGPPCPGAWTAKHRQHVCVQEAGGSDCRQEMGLRLAGALVEFWYWRAHRREGLQWLDRALERDTGAPTVARARALIGRRVSPLDLGGSPRRAARVSATPSRSIGLVGPPLDLALALCLFGYWLRGGQYWLRGLGGDAPTPRSTRKEQP